MKSLALSKIFVVRAQNVGDDKAKIIVYKIEIQRSVFLARKNDARI